MCCQLSIAAWQMTSKVSNIKPQYIKLAISMSQEYLRVSDEDIVIWGCNHLEVWLALEDSLLRWPTHMLLLLAGVPDGPLHMLLECPHNLVAGLLQNGWSKKRQGMDNDLASEITHHWFCHIVFIRSNSLNLVCIQRVGIYSPHFEGKMCQRICAHRFEPPLV